MSAAAVDLLVMRNELKRLEAADKRSLFGYSNARYYLRRAIFEAAAYLIGRGAS
jgi:hypothetical protein